MAEPFSTNELFLRSDRIVFGKTPPEVPERTEQTIILPDVTGSKLYFGLSTLVSTSGITGTLEAIYPQFASFTFDNLNKRLGINVSTPQYSIDISTLTGVRIVGGTLIANAQGLVSVPTAALFSTLPSYVFAPGTIPPTAIASTGAVIPGISVPTSALFGTLATPLFAPSTIPLLALQSSGIIVASSFVGDGYYLSNIPLANINGTITGDFFRPNSIPLSTLASTGQIWIREPSGSIFAPMISTGQLYTSSFYANNISTLRLTTGTLFASTITASSFTSLTFNAINLSSLSLTTSTIVAGNRITAGAFYGDGEFITNLSPAALNNVIPSDKFGYRLIAINAINPYGNWSWEAGTITFKQAAPLIALGSITASSFQGGFFIGDGSGLRNINGISSLSLASTVTGLGSSGYVSTLSLTSSLQGLGTLRYVSTQSLVSTTSALSVQLISTLEGLATSGYLSTLHLISTIDGLGTAGYVSTLSLTSSLQGLGTLNYVSTLSLRSTTGALVTQFNSTVEGLGSLNYISSSQLFSSIHGLATVGYISTTQLQSTVFSLETSAISTNLGNRNELTSSLVGLATFGYVSSTQLRSTVAGLGSANYISSLQLFSTVTGLEFYISSFIDPTELQSTLLSSLTGLQLGAKFVSTVEGLGTVGYTSTQTLYSTVYAAISSLSTAYGIEGILSRIPSTFSTVAIFTSSVITSTLIASTILTSTVTGSQIQFITLSSQALYVSSLFTATRQMTPMFITF